MSRDLKPVVVTGPAGTGKSYMAAVHAAKFLSENTKNSVKLIRPNRGCGPTLGALPGELDEKLAPWARPFVDAVASVLGKKHVENLLSKGRIEVLALEHIRGMTFDNAFIVCDEAQNCTVDELKAFLTRTGNHSRVIVNGDVNQNDLGRDSGLGYVRDMVLDLDLNVSTINFTIEDCMRSGQCRMWLEAFSQYEEVY